MPSTGLIVSVTAIDLTDPFNNCQSLQLTNVKHRTVALRIYNLPNEGIVLQKGTDIMSTLLGRASWKNAKRERRDSYL
jgi:hypothetical protein